MRTYCRPLNDLRLAQGFVENILDIRNPSRCSKAVSLIVKTELQNQNIENKSTMFHDNFRDIRYVSHQARMALRTKIFEELILNVRPANDDTIRLGYGGALPIGIKPKQERQAYLIIGLPASGKSCISNQISDSCGGVILDSDFAKRKFPEFKMDFGASLVHDESTDIVFGDQNVSEYNMLEYCSEAGYNIVIPKIGHHAEPILGLTNQLRNWDYDIHLTLVSLDRKKATRRAFSRFEKTGRYVPLSLIFDGYSNDPILTYYRLRGNSLFASYGKVSTDVGRGLPPKFIEGSDGNPAKLFEAVVCGKMS